MTCGCMCVIIYIKLNLLNRYTMPKLARITRSLRMFTSLERRGETVDHEPNDLIIKRQERQERAKESKR